MQLAGRLLNRAASRAPQRSACIQQCSIRIRGAASVSLGGGRLVTGDSPQLTVVRSASSSSASLAEAAAAAPNSASTSAAAASSQHGQQQPDIVALLRERGLLQEVTSEDLGRLSTSTSLSVYCGFDPTADSLHLGNLLGIVVLSWFHRCGHTPVVLLGGATGRVGDPSGRSTERPVLSEDEIEANVAAIGACLEGILARSAPPGSPPTRVFNNLSWFGGMSFLGFLRDVGKHARVGAMMAKDSVRTRMESEQGISFTEFTYQLLQGYDFVHLRHEHGVRVQVGGSDQWGNITAGTDLIRRLLGGGGPGGGGAEAADEAAAAEAAAAPDCYGLTFPLLVDSEGRKVGKSTGGAVWLSAARLSPYKFYQHLFGTADADVPRFLRLLTFLPMHEISEIQKSMGREGYVPNTAQRRLAEEVTRFVHGEEGLQQALRATEALKPGAATALDCATLEAIAGDAPTSELPKAQVAGQLVVDVMVASGMLKSKGEVRRMIKGGGVYLNNAKVADEGAAVAEGDLIEGRLLLLAAGKKNKMLVRVV